MVAPIVGMALSYTDAIPLLSEWTLQCFPQSSVFISTMTSNLFHALFTPKTSVSLPDPAAKPTEEDIQGHWRGVYAGYGPEVLSVSVIASEEEGKSVFATKLTGDPYVPKVKMQLALLLDLSFFKF